MALHLNGVDIHTGRSYELKVDRDSFTATEIGTGKENTHNTDSQCSVRLCVVGDAPCLIEVLCGKVMHGYKIDPAKVTELDPYRVSPLYARDIRSPQRLTSWWAAAIGYADALVARTGSFPTTFDADGRTALHWAAMSGKHLVIAGLIERGIDPDLLDSKGLAAVHYAVLVSNESDALMTIEALGHCGANLDRKNKGVVAPTTAAQMAIRRNSLPLLRCLLTLGADVDLTGFNIKFRTLYASDPSILEATVVRRETVSFLRNVFDEEALADIVGDYLSVSNDTMRHNARSASKRRRLLA